MRIVVDILHSLKGGDSYEGGLRSSFGGFLLLTANLAVHLTG